MKKLLIALLLAALLIPSALAETQEPPTPEDPQFYDCYGIIFAAPEGFTRQETDEEELVFVNAEKSAAVQVFATEVEGVTWGNARTYLSDKYQYRAFSCNTSAKINGIPCINCVYADEFEPAYGRITVFLDEAEAVAWVFVFHSLLPLTDADRETWSDLLCSISAPMLLPTPTPTPEPTATPVPTRAPGTSVYFDYDALINDPEGHKGMCFFVVGTANKIDPMELNYGDWSRPASTLLSVDGELFKIAFVVFDNPEGESEVKEGDPIQIFGEYIGTTELKTTLGVYVTAPMIFAHSVEKLDALP